MASGNNPRLFKRCLKLRPWWEDFDNNPMMVHLLIKPYLRYVFLAKFFFGYILGKFFWVLNFASYEFTGGIGLSLYLLSQPEHVSRV